VLQVCLSFAAEKNHFSAGDSLEKLRAPRREAGDLISRQVVVVTACGSCGGKECSESIGMEATRDRKYLGNKPTQKTIALKTRQEGLNNPPMTFFKALNRYKSRFCFFVPQ
jgi:hypothetical protein